MIPYTYSGLKPAKALYRYVLIHNETMKAVDTLLRVSVLDLSG